MDLGVKRSGQTARTEIAFLRGIKNITKEKKEKSSYLQDVVEVESLKEVHQKFTII